MVYDALNNYEKLLSTFYGVEYQSLALKNGRITVDQSKFGKIGNGQENCLNEQVHAVRLYQHDFFGCFPC